MTRDIIQAAIVIWISIMQSDLNVSRGFWPLLIYRSVPIMLAVMLAADLIARLMVAPK